MKLTAFIIIISALYIIIENKLVLVTRTEFFNNNMDRIKIIHLSDLHRRSFGRNNNRLIKKINSLQQDIIIFRGDLIK